MNGGREGGREKGREEGREGGRAGYVRCRGRDGRGGGASEFPALGRCGQKGPERERKEGGREGGREGGKLGADFKEIGKRPREGGREGGRERGVTYRPEEFGECLHIEPNLKELLLLHPRQDDGG